MNVIGFHTTSLINTIYEILNEAKSGAAAEGLSGLLRLREWSTFSTNGVEPFDGLLGGHLCPLLHRLQNKFREKFVKTLERHRYDSY